MAKVEVIGFGSIGKRHARNLAQIGHEVFVYDPEFPAGVSSVEELLEKVEAIVIASPTESHYGDIYQCLQKTMNVFVEKPVSHSLEEPLDPTLLAQVMMVGYNLRFHSCVLKAKEWIKNDYIGEPLWASLVCAQYNNKPEYLRDGVILNWSHEIDLALHLLDRAEVVACSARVLNVGEDIADIVLKHENGARSNIHLDYVTKPEVRQTMVVGDEATIILDLVNRQAWLRHTDGGILEHFAGTDSFDSNYLDEMRAFTALIEGKEAPIGCTAEEGLDTLKICLDARKLAGL